MLVEVAVTVAVTAGSKRRRSAKTLVAVSVLLHHVVLHLGSRLKLSTCLGGSTSVRAFGSLSLIVTRAL